MLKINSKDDGVLKGWGQIPGSIGRLPVVSETPPEFEFLPFPAQMVVTTSRKIIKPPMEWTLYFAFVIHSSAGS